MWRHFRTKFEGVADWQQGRVKTDTKLAVRPRFPRHFLFIFFFDESRSNFRASVNEAEEDILEH